jgi:hypothetical protein
MSTVERSRAYPAEPSVVPTGLGFVMNVYPGLTPWANLVSPSGLVLHAHATSMSPARRAKLISPQRKLWVADFIYTGAPSGAAQSGKNMIGLDPNVCGLQHRQELLLKRMRPMMGRLIGDVMLDPIELGRADAERSVAFLPRE